MVKKSARKSSRTLTAKEKTRLRKLRAAVEADQEDILRRGGEVFTEHERAVAQAIGDLKQARRAQGLTLQEVANRMGTDRSNVHRLEQCFGNPTVATVARYARALGRQMVITLNPIS